jgi:hypothetical protein
MQVPIQGYERFHYQAFLEGVTYFVTLIGFLIAGIYLVNAAFKRRQRMQMQQKLLDKFSSAHDFAEFMQSPAGQKYVMSFTDAVTSPRNAIFNALRTGFVLTGVGMGFLAEAYSGVSRRIGWVAFLAGIGFLISAAVSYFLAKKGGWKQEE